jgi:hypothetical protein
MSTVGLIIKIQVRSPEIMFTASKSVVVTEPPRLGSKGIYIIVFPL